MTQMEGVNQTIEGSLKIPHILPQPLSVLIMEPQDL